MRKPLEKNEFLQQFEGLSKKHGYDTVYCKGDFDGTKKGGLSYVILAPGNHEVNREFSQLIDPVWGLEEYDWRDMSGIVIKQLPVESVVWLGEPVYREGEFYANER